MRLLDPADAAIPSHDLLAVYLRRTGTDLDLRLDFLDSAALPDYDLTILLDLPAHAGQDHSLPHPDIHWDALLVIPARGDLRLLNAARRPIRGAGMRVLRNPAMDQLTVRLSGLPGANDRARVQVFVAPAGSPTLADLSEQTSHQAARLRPARIALAFTNPFPAYSASSALRRWRGAHTGPLGGSHGLALLLDAARDAGVPVALAGLDRPEALAALDAVDGLPQLREMQAQGLLALPTSRPGPAAAWQQAAAGRFDLAFTYSSYTQAGAPAVQVTTDAAAPATRYADPLQITTAGPTPDLNRALIQAALDANRPNAPPAPLILGGELPGSAWGAANHAAAAFHYLDSRPWVRFLSAGELRAAAAQPTARFEPDLSVTQRRELLAALRAAPANNLSLAARQAYASLSAPVYPSAEGLAALRAGYTGVVWSLLAAAAWAENPQPRLDCLGDPDRDGQAECLLADARRYAQFEADGTLTHLFSLEPTGARQWIAPSAQFIVGQSDPQGWDPPRGLLADPAVIPGAFYATALPAGLPWGAGVEDGRLVFRTTDGRQEKVFTLEADGLRAELRLPPGGTPGGIPIALAPDPWRRFEPGWASAYAWRRAGDGSLEVIAPGSPRPAVRVRSACPLAVQAFSDSAQWLARAENPDRDYPPGHYLPFPMFLIQCSPGTQNPVIIKIGE